MSIRQCIDYYNELVDTEFLDSTREILREHIYAHDLLYRAPHPHRVLRPHIVSASTYEDVSRTVSILALAIATAADRLATDPQLRRALCLPEYLEPLIAFDPEKGAHSAVARFDGFISGTSAFTAIEYNSEPHGIHRGFELNAAFASMPIASAFGKRYPFRWPNILDLAYDAVLRQHKERGGRGTPTLGVLGADHDLGSRPDMRWLSYVAARGCHVVPATIDEFRYTKGRLYLKDLAIDLIALLDWTELILRPSGVSAVLDAVKAGAVVVVNGLSRGLLSTYKSAFEILSDPKYCSLFSPQVTAILRRHVPWTRVLRNCRATYHDQEIDLLSYVADHRHDFVLKPSGGSEGVGVLLGWCVTEDGWHKALKRTPGHYVVQERVPAPVSLYPVDTGEAMQWQDLRTDCGPYVWNARHAVGWLARSSASDLLNVAAGSMNTPVWIVDDPDCDHT